MRRYRATLVYPEDDRQPPMVLFAENPDEVFTMVTGEAPPLKVSMSLDEKRRIYPSKPAVEVERF